MHKKDSGLREPLWHREAERMSGTRAAVKIELFLKLGQLVELSFPSKKNIGFAQGQLVSNDAKNKRVEKHVMFYSFY